MRAQLLHLSGPLRGRTITYPDRLVRIGSGEHSEARILSSVVASNHAEIEWVKAECKFHLRAFEGAVFINGNEVAEVILKDGDLLEFGAGGPVARFRIYVPTGAVCKPVRRMLGDAKELALHSGSAAATRMLTKDLLTQATMTLKVGFPLALVGTFGIALWLGGWMNKQPGHVQDLLTADAVIQAEIDAMRAEYQAEIKRLSQGNDVIRRVQKEWTRGVCLIHGVYRMRDPDGSLQLSFAGQPIQVEYTGSGFLVSEEGHIVTNRHVALPWTEDADHMAAIAMGASPEFKRLTVTFPGRQPIDVAQSTLRRREDQLDVALMQISEEQAKGIPVLPMRQDGTEGEGQRAIVVGYPTGLAALLARASSDTLADLRQNAASTADAIEQLAAAQQIKPVITLGVISNTEAHLIAYDAGTTSGGSGGPVFSNKGDVIAVNFAIQRNFVGNNLGVPIRYALELLQKK